MFQRPGYPPFGPQGPQPFFSPDQSPLMQAGPQGQPMAPTVDTTQAPGTQNQLLEAMRARAMAEQVGISPDIHATSPLTALAATLQGGLKGYMQGNAVDAQDKAEGQSRSALLDALSSPDPMQALSLSQDPRAQDLYINSRVNQLGQKPQERWTDQDINNDGVPDYSVNSATGERKAVSAPDLTFDQRKALAREGRANTTVNVGGGSDKQIFEALGKSYDSAASAATGLRSITEAERALQGPGVYGQFADERLALQKIGAALGVGDTTPITNTETFRSAIAPNIAAIMKATVGSTQISDSDRAFAEKAAGGSISLDKTSIQRLLGIARRAQQGMIDQHNQRLDRVYPRGKSFDRERALFEVAPAQASTSTPDWAK